MLEAASILYEFHGRVNNKAAATTLPVASP